MPEYISKDVAFQRLLCKESEFHHWNDYNLAQSKEITTDQTIASL